MGRLLPALVLLPLLAGCQRAAQRYDVVVYGGTSSGVMAAVTAARLGRSVVSRTASRLVVKSISEARSLTANSERRAGRAIPAET